MRPLHKEQIGTGPSHSIALIAVMGMTCGGMLAISKLWMPALRSRYETYPKIPAVALGCGLLLGMMAAGYLPLVRVAKNVDGLPGGRTSRVRRFLLGSDGPLRIFPILMILYLAWTCISYFFAPTDGTREMVLRGIPFALLYAIPALVVRRALRCRRDFQLVVWTYAVLTVAAAAFGLLDNAGLLIAPFSGSRFPMAVQRPFGNTNFVGPLLAPAAALLTVRLISALSAFFGKAGGQFAGDSKRVLAFRAASLLIGLAVVLGAAWLAGSLSGNIAVAASLALLPFGFSRSRAGAFILGAAFLSAAAGCYFVLLNDAAWGAFWNGANAPGSTMAVRTFLGAGALEMFRARPLTGWGYGNFLSVYPAFELANANDHFWVRQGISANAHNEYLQILSELGIVGFVLFMLAIIVPIVMTRSAMRSEPDARHRATTIALTSGLCGMLLANAFSVSLRFWDVAPIFWALFGAMTAAGEGLPAETADAILLAAPAARSKAVRILCWTTLAVVFMVFSNVFINEYASDCSYARASEWQARIGPDQDAANKAVHATASAISTGLQPAHHLYGLKKAADLFHRLGSPQLSLEFLLRLRRLAPHYEAARIDIIRRLAQLERHDDARREAEDFARRNHESPSAWMLLAEVELHRERRPTREAADAALVASILAVRNAAQWKNEPRMGGEIAEELLRAAELCAASGLPGRRRLVLDAVVNPILQSAALADREGLVDSRVCALFLDAARLCAAEGMEAEARAILKAAAPSALRLGAYYARMPAPQRRRAVSLLAGMAELCEQNALYGCAADMLDKIRTMGTDAPGLDRKIEQLRALEAGR